MFPRNPGSWGDGQILDETTFYSYGVIWIYGDGSAWVVHTTNTTDYTLMLAYDDAYYGRVPYMGFTGGEFYNFILKTNYGGYYPY